MALRLDTGPVLHPRGQRDGVCRTAWAAAPRPSRKERRGHRPAHVQGYGLWPEPVDDGIQGLLPPQHDLPAHPGAVDGTRGTRV